MIAACERRNATHASRSRACVGLLIVVVSDILASSSVAAGPGSSGPLDRLSYMPEDRNGIEVEGLVRTFKDVRADDGIDISIAPGEIYGFLGPNGAGKSTTVHILTTLLPPTAGRASVAGHDVVREGPKVRARIGAALQETALDPFLTGREHLRLQASLHGIRGEARRALIDELLARVGLTSAGDRSEERRVGTWRS